MEASELHSNLGMFCGSETITRHNLAKSVCMTEGVLYLREHGNCFWLIDDIAFYQKHPKIIQATQKDERFRDIQFWWLRKTGENQAVLECAADSGEKPVFSQKIEYTDFPFPSVGEFKLYVMRTWVGEQEVMLIALPSEY